MPMVGIAERPVDHAVAVAAGEQTRSGSPSDGSKPAWSPCRHQLDRAQQAPPARIADQRVVAQRGEARRKTCAHGLAFARIPPSV